MKILYGTTNPAKLSHMQATLSPLGIDLVGLKDLCLPIPMVEERGNSPLENAVIKARAYYEAFHIPVFSCDSGLFFHGLEDGLQPGTHIRRVMGRELCDEEMTLYYMGLSKRFDNRLIGQYKNAISFILDDSHVFNSMDEALWTAPFMLTDVPHKKLVTGFPLDCISIDPVSRQYYYDMSDSLNDSSYLSQGFRDFFTKALQALGNMA